MAESSRTPVARQLEHLRNRFAQQPGLPFADLLPDDTPQLLKADTGDPIYTPLVTLGLFLGQVLDPNASCRQAVARLLARRSAEGLSPCCANTGAYCKARGFRVKRYELITTLTDVREYPVAELGQLYRRRWEAELNLRAVKSSMGMDQLRCKSASMVRKELWLYLLGYNLVRGVMAQSAAVVGVAPRSLSFAGAMQSVGAFGELLSLAAGVNVAESLRRLWLAVGTHRVGNRPNRVEPRAIKRRKKDFPQLKQPRQLAQQRLLRSA